MTTTVITGANRGIGLALTEQLLAKGHQVIAVCREASSELNALDGVRIESGIDVTLSSGIAELRARFEGQSIDWLINNAGVLRRSSLDDLEQQLDDFRLQFEVNALAPVRVISALRSCLGRGSRVFIITSRMGSMADNTSGGHYAYRMSKAAVNAAAVSMAHDLRDQGIAVGLLHPGYVRTGMTGHTGHVDAGEAAAGLIQRMEALDLDSSGRFFHANGDPLPW
ncbi:MAG: SDR family oxidoreductase [Wenzhouxiangella sp.]